MKNVLKIMVVLTLLVLPLTAFASEGPMTLPDGAPAEAKSHNQEGIDHWNQGHYEVALKHFQAAGKADHSIGEIHFNEAICLDKIGKHGDATTHFKAAKKNAHGNKHILESPILNAHIGH